VALRKSPEEKAAQQAEKERKAAKAADQKRLQEIERQRRIFISTPAGRARDAFDEGDQVFQCSFNVMSQQAIVVAMIGSSTSKSTTDPTDILNSVCREGWELLTGSFVFVEEGSQSRDKFLSSGQNVAVKGATMGYYLFKRCEANAQPRVNPWEQAAAK
jgi:hypothetical protein